MTSHRVIEHLISSIEEEFLGYKIYIENNPDHYRGGYEWSVSKGDDIWDSGLAFTIESAISEAEKSIIELNNDTRHAPDDTLRECCSKAIR